jgi:hypothetical protein
MLPSTGRDSRINRSIRGGSMAYEFFLSYTRANNDVFMKKFFDELSQAERAPAAALQMLLNASGAFPPFATKSVNLRSEGVLPVFLMPSAPEPDPVQRSGAKAK